MERTGDANTGQSSGRVFNRPDSWRNPSQLIHDVVEPGKSYFFSAYVKITTPAEGSLFTSFHSQLQYTYTGGDSDYSGFGASPMVRMDSGWQKIGGDFTVSNRQDISTLRLYVQAPAAVDFLIDTSSLKEIIPDSQWKEAAQERIQELRTSDLNIQVSISNDFNPSDIDIKVDMTRHAFPFGSAIKYWLIDGSTERDMKYQDFFFDNFNWAVLEWSLKWSNMERDMGNPNYSMAESAIVQIEARDIQVRGHTVFWGKNADPDWVLALEGDDLRQEIDRRLDGVVDYFKGRLIHWDVNNEVLHGRFYEEATNDPTITDYMFQRAAEIDPDCVLFLNDYGIVNYGQSTVALTTLAAEMIARGAPVEALGAQSHLSGPQNIHNIKKRVDVVGEADLPLYITELSVQNGDVNRRAQDLEDAMILYFSHPAIEGILIWGFWDEENYNPDTSLVDGPDLIPNAAGEAFLNLLHNEWHTSATLNPGGQDENFLMRAFHGDYNLVVEHQGAEIQKQTFSVVKGQTNTVQVNIQ